MGIFKLSMQKKNKEKKEQWISHANEMQVVQFKALQWFYLQIFTFAWVMCCPCSFSSAPSLAPVLLFYYKQSFLNSNLIRPRLYKKIRALRLPCCIAEPAQRRHFKLMLFTMPLGAIDEVGMAVWRYGGFISLTGVLKNQIVRIACAVGAQQHWHVLQPHPNVSNGEIPLDIWGHIEQHFLPLFSILPLGFLSPRKHEDAQTNQFTRRWVSFMVWFLWRSR